MKYAVINIGGKQFMVREGDTIELERQPKPLKYTVLTYSDGSKTEIGKPVVEDVHISTIVEEKRGKKILVSRFKPKSRYDKTNGHRQLLSVVKILQITRGKEEAAEAKAAAENPIKPARKPTARKTSIVTKVTKSKAKEA